MKTFARHRTMEELRAMVAEVPGLTICTKAYDKGSDFIRVGADAPNWNELGYVLFNPMNGRFVGCKPVAKDGERKLFTSDERLDGEPWFAALLDIFYVEKGAKA